LITSDDKFLMPLRGHELQDRRIAGEPLLSRAERMRGNRSEHPVGSLDGFHAFGADNFMQGPELVMKGTFDHSCSKS
jgi:hypothetical protein